jgi:hypothetical protein
MEARAITEDKPCEAFWPAQSKFEELVKNLQSERCRGMTHDELEEEVTREGRELLRRMLQGHLDWRGPGPVSEPVVGADGVERTQRRELGRKLNSVFGTVVVSRFGYGAARTTSLFPLEAELNMPKESYSLGVRYKVAKAAAEVSFDSVVTNVADAIGYTVPKRQLEQLAARASIDFDEFYAQRPRGAGEDDDGVLVLTTDGKGVAMRREDLRKQTRKAAEKRTPKLKKRASKGEKTATKRMAQVASVYIIDRFMREPHDIVGEFTNKEDVKPARPRPHDKRVWASLTHEAHEVIGEAFAEAERRDPRRSKDWVVLVDGGEHQLDCVLEFCGRYGGDSTVIVDVIHVLEYIWGAGRALFGEGAPESERWVTEQLGELLAGQASDIAANMQRMATRLDLTQHKRAAVDTCAGYLRKYAEFLRYDLYLAEGYPIATGVIEGACRYVVKDRMGITGARWSLAGGEAVLRLRALKASGDFDDYWAFHRAREFERNHQALYAHGHVPATATASRERRKALLSLVP